MTALALDVGTARIGVAVSDELETMCFPLETIPARDRPTAVDRIRAIVEERGITIVVVGLPLDFDGREGQAVRRVRKLIAVLEPILDVPIVEWDERLSTVAAERSLLEGDMRRKKRKTVIDQVAATLFLQSWLDARRSPDER